MQRTQLDSERGRLEGTFTGQGLTVITTFPSVYLTGLCLGVGERKEESRVPGGVFSLGNAEQVGPAVSIPCAPDGHSGRF